VAVEFVHPVIVGKRALPALAPPPHRVGALERADDMILVIDRGGASAAPRATVVLADPDSALEGEHVLRVPTRDPLLARELQVTLYHLLWETVHVFLEHPEIAGRVA
jgi:D-sedoheptulose 7-phosphate isomerase